MMQNVAAPEQKLVEAALEQSGFIERLNTLPNGMLTSADMFRCQAKYYQQNQEIVACCVEVHFESYFNLNRS